MIIPIIDDNIVEGIETFFMTLVPGQGNPQIDPQMSVATIIIIDDDGEYTPGYYIYTLRILCCSHLYIHVYFAVTLGYFAVIHNNYHYSYILPLVCKALCISYSTLKRAYKLQHIPTKGAIIYL